jgi:hypothetical protein
MCWIVWNSLVFSIRQLDFGASPSGELAVYKFRERWIPVPLPPPPFRDQHFSATNILRWHSIGIHHHSGIHDGRDRASRGNCARSEWGQSSTLINAFDSASIGGHERRESCDARSTLNRAPPPFCSCSVKVVASPRNQLCSLSNFSDIGRPVLAVLGFRQVAVAAGARNYFTCETISLAPGGGVFGLAGGFLCVAADAKMQPPRDAFSLQAR